MVEVITWGGGIGPDGGYLLGVAGLESLQRGICQGRHVGWGRSTGEYKSRVNGASKVDEECQN